MPKLYDADPRSPERVEIDDGHGIDRYLQPVVGSFAIHDLVQTGGHPESVRQAWTGLVLPVRRLAIPNMWRENDHGPFTPVEMRAAFGAVDIFAHDAFSALVDGKRSERVRQYWMDLLNGPSSKITDKLVFRMGENDVLTIDPQLYIKETRSLIAPWSYDEEPPF